MKKVLLSAAVATFFFASCGPSVCDCVSEAAKDEPNEDTMKECKSMMEDADEDAQKKMMEEAKDCK